MGFGKDGKGQILYETSISSLDMGALAARDAVEFVGSFNDALEEDFRILRVDYWISIRGAQAIVLEDGPIWVGFAAGNLAAGDVEGAIETIPVNQNDLGLENTNRPIWPLEMFTVQDPDTQAGDHQTIKGSFNPKWTFNNPDGWTWWVYNSSAFALVTGSAITINAKIFGMWVA